MAKKKHHKKESFVTGLMNTVITLVLTGVMVYGLQCYSASSLKFAQVSDVHFLQEGSNTTFKMTGESPKLLDDAVAQINETPNINFVMFTGDLIDKPFEKELTAVLPHVEKLNVPWYFAFGNHDRCVGGFLTKELYLDILGSHNENMLGKGRYYSFEPRKGYKVIVLDTIISDRLTSQGFVDEGQLKWLDEELNDAKKDTVLIFMHVPIMEPFPSESHRLQNAGTLQAVIEKYKNPIAVFSGHYHAAKIIQNGNVLYVNSPALVSYPNAFRIVTVTNTRKKVIFDIQMKETRETGVQKMAKLLVFASNIYAGSSKDQTAVYEIKK